MGFDITIEIEAGGTSSEAEPVRRGRQGRHSDQRRESAGAPSTPANVDSYFGDARRAAFWIEDKNLGRVTVGRYESAGAITTIDLAGISASAPVRPVRSGQRQLPDRGSTDGHFTGISWANIGDPAANQGRTELIRYDSPTIAGFVCVGVDR